MAEQQQRGKKTRKRPILQPLPNVTQEAVPLPQQPSPPQLGAEDVMDDHFAPQTGPETLSSGKFYNVHIINNSAANFFNYTWWHP